MATSEVSVTDDKPQSKDATPAQILAFLLLVTYAALTLAVANVDARELPDWIDPAKTVTGYALLIVMLRGTWRWLKSVQAEAAKKVALQADLPKPKKATLKAGYLLKAPPGAQHTFKLIAGDYPHANSTGYLYVDGVVLPVSRDEAFDDGDPLPIWQARNCYKTFAFDQLADVSVCAAGQPRSLMGVLATGALASAFVGQLAALGAGAAVAKRNDQEIVAFECVDGKRVLSQMDTVGLTKLQFALRRKLPNATTAA